MDCSLRILLDLPITRLSQGIYGSPEDAARSCNSTNVSHIIVDQAFVSTEHSEYDLKKELADKFAISYPGKGGSFLKDMRQHSYRFVIVSCEDLSVDHY